MVIGFSTYLKEEQTKGASTALSGHANEHLTNNLIKDVYAPKRDEFEKKGLNTKEAHKKALEFMMNKPYKHEEALAHPELKTAANYFGKDEMKNIHHDSKKTAETIINHLHHNYNSDVRGSSHVGKGGPKAVEALTGAPSQADVVVHTKKKTGEEGHALATLEHFGASLKYSKAKGDVKIHGPGIDTAAKIVDDHHKEMFGKSSGLKEKLKKIADEGVNNQRMELKKHHNVVKKHLEAVRENLLKKIPKADRNDPAAMKKHMTKVDKFSIEKHLDENGISF